MPRPIRTRRRDLRLATGVLLLTASNLSVLASQVDLSRAAARGQDGVVTLQATINPGLPPELSTGVVLDSTGLVACAYHAVRGAQSVVAHDASGHPWAAEILGGDLELDVAVLQLATDGTTWHPLTPGTIPPVGEPILAVGNPLGFAPIFTGGVIAAHPRPGANGNSPASFILVDAMVAPGSSGGPVLDRAGHWVGMIVGKATVERETVDLGLVIPAAVVDSTARVLVSGGAPLAGWLGVETQELTPTLASALGIGGIAGALVIQAYGPALAAGVRSGDVINTIDGHSVMEPADIHQVEQELDPSREVLVGISRNQTTHLLPVVLGNAPSRTPKAEVSPALGTFVRAGFTLAEVTTPPTVLVVIRVIPGSPADRAGLQQGDVIDSVGLRAASMERIRDAVSSIEPELPYLLLRIQGRSGAQLKALDLS